MTINRTFIARIQREGGAESHSGFKGRVGLKVTVDSKGGWG